MPPEVSFPSIFSLPEQKLTDSKEASNCGGVAVSGLEMAQNSQRLTWTPEEVDAKLKSIMTECYNVSLPYRSVTTDILTDPLHPSDLSKSGK